MRISLSFLSQDPGTRLSVPTLEWMKFIINESQYTESDYKSLPASYFPHSQWYKSLYVETHWKTHNVAWLPVLPTCNFGTHSWLLLWSTVQGSLIPRHTYYSCAPCRIVENRVWTLSLWELGQVYIQWSVNWIIVGVNYIIHYQMHLLGAKRIANWLFAMTHNAIYFAWAI